MPEASIIAGFELLSRHYISKIPTCKQYLKATLIRHFNSVEYAFLEFDVPELTVFSIVGNVK